MSQSFPEHFTGVIVEYPRRILLSDQCGEYSSEDIYNASAFIRTVLLEGKDLRGKQVAILCPPGLTFVASMLAGWMCGAMVVPLCIEHPEAELDHVISDSLAVHILCHPALKDKVVSHGKKTILVQQSDITSENIPVNWEWPGAGDNALMLYTSGTTGKPKGVVHTHASLLAQIECLVNAWEWKESDRILHFLPLHHTHGLVNKLLCALYSVARCDMMEKFNTRDVIEKLVKQPYSLFMAVPTVYVKLVHELEITDAGVIEKFRKRCAEMRVMISGSAALQLPVFGRWKELTGHILLERYGMTELGMVLSNPLYGERRIGTVGIPLPGMEVQLRNKEEIVKGDGEGELEVRGKNVFTEYWRRKEETEKSFTKDGWFRTGDYVERKDGYYIIRGRISTDIIKSGGYKISALEIESVLIDHPDITECAVIAVPDETRGERIVAVVKLKDEKEITLEELKEYCRSRLANYKIPAELKVIDQLPRNAMGKIMKPELKKMVK